MTEEMPAAPPPSPLPPPRRRRIRLALFGGALLLCGMVLGGAGTLLYVERAVSQGLRQPDRLPGLIAQRLRRPLRLDSAQQQEIQAILEARQANLMAIRREFHPRVQAELDQVRAEVAEVLDPGQAERWERLFARMRERFQLPPPVK